MGRKVQVFTTEVLETQNRLIYSIKKNRNRAYSDGILYEYGIKCSLCNMQGERLMSENVSCISADLRKVRGIAQILVRNQVYPVHLREILDELVSDDMFLGDNNTSPTLKTA